MFMLKNIIIIINAALGYDGIKTKLIKKLKLVLAPNISKIINLIIIIIILLTFYVN